jgi:hypothetical protein
MIDTSQTIETHVTSSPYIVKVCDILYVGGGPMIVAAKHLTAGTGHLMSLLGTYMRPI